MQNNMIFFSTKFYYQLTINNQVVVPPRIIAVELEKESVP